jgi:hypothetical protein
MKKQLGVKKDLQPEKYVLESSMRLPFAPFEDNDLFPTFPQGSLRSPRAIQIEPFQGSPEFGPFSPF